MGKMVRCALCTQSIRMLKPYSRGTHLCSGCYNRVANTAFRRIPYKTAAR